MEANDNGLFEKYVENAVKVAKFNVNHVIIDEEKHGRWYNEEDRVIVIGDAAHAITPFGGHGCNLAFYDAICLGFLVDKYNKDLDNGYKEIFKELYKIRKDHSYEISARAARMGKLYTLPKEKHGVRNKVLGIANKLGITEKMFAKMTLPQVGFDILSQTKDI